MSPSSMNWGSQTSLNRLPQQNRFSNGTANTGGNFSELSENDYPNSASAGLGPAIPLKEPLLTQSPNIPQLPPKIRNGKLQKPSPLSTERLNANNPYGDGYEPGGSPRSAAAKLSGALGVPARKPTGPRSMSSASKSGELNRDETVIRRKNRDTFGTIASNNSGESETF